MTTKKIVIIFIMALFLFTFMGMVTTAQNDLQEKLQELVNTELAAYQEKFPDYPGGLAMEVISKQGTFLSQPEWELISPIRYISGQPAIPRPLHQLLFYCFISRVN